MKRITLALPAPYVGLRPFTESDALLFFGRDAHVRELLAKLEREQRFLAVLGASGTGKSSLVRAGLIPALHRGALHPRQVDSGRAASIVQWNVCIFTPGDAPLTRLAHALTQDPRWADRIDPGQAESSLGTLLGASPLALAQLFRQKSSLFGDEALLLVVDQFEEIFRYRQRNPDEADRFVKLLLRSAVEEVPIYVVMTMRSDFLGKAVAFHGLAEAINGGIYLTPRLGSEQIRSVIASPLSLVGGAIDPVLANRLVNTLGGEDELPVLQHALLRMWDRARSQRRSRIEAEDFAAVCAPRSGQGEPMLSFAIDHHASRIYDALTEAQCRVARRLFLSLAERRDGRDLRRPQALADLLAQVGNESQDALMAVIEAFRAPGVGFVLPAAGQPIGKDDLIDISHESLIRRWHRFQAWMAEEDIDVAELREWQQRAQRRMDGGGWLDENDVERAQRWRARVGDRGDPEFWAAWYTAPGSYQRVDDYIQSSVERAIQAKAEQQALKREAEEARVKRFEVEAQLQRAAAERAAADKVQAEKERESALAMAAVNRRRSRIAMAGGLAALVFGIVAALSWFQARQALGRANALAATAQAGELATMAEGLGKDFPDQSLLLALQARRIDPVPRANAMLRAAHAAYAYRIVLRGHEGDVNAARFSADGKTALTASADKTARLWDVVNGNELRVLRGHEGEVLDAQFSPDGKMALTASADTTARLWDVASGTELRALRGHADEVLGAQFSADGASVLTASRDGTARLWDVASGKELRALRGHVDRVLGAQLSPDGKLALTAGTDRSARLWDVGSGKELRALRGHAGEVLSAQFSADGKTVLTGGADSTARLWDVAGGKELRALRGHKGEVVGARFSADGKTVVTASGDGTARLWNAASGNELRVLRGHEDSVRSAQFSADGVTVLTASADGTARLWAASSGDELRALRGHEGEVIGARFSADGSTVLTASPDKTARLWDIASGSEVRVLRGHDDEILASQFSADGKLVLTASRDRSARLWDAASGNELRALQGHGSWITGAQFSADSTTVLTASWDKTARVWDVTSGKELQNLRGHTGVIHGAQSSGDGKMAITAGADRSARLWDVAGGRQLRVLQGHEVEVLGAQFAADGKTALTASADRTARVWDVATAKELRVLRGHEGEVVSAQFSADGRSVLTASADRTARLWDVACGRELRVLRGHGRGVLGARLSADGKIALTASSDKTARL